MPKSLISMVPDAAAAFELEPHELGEVLLDYIQSLSPNDLFQLNRHSFFLVSGGVGTFREYPLALQEAMATVFKEGWLWLEREGMLPTLGTTGEGYLLSRLGSKLKTRADVRDYRRGRLLPREQLHARIADKVLGDVLSRAV